MRVTLIKPKIGRRPDGPYVDAGRMEPLMLAVLAGMTPAGVKIRAVDDRFERIDYAAPTDLVGITVETFTARRAYQIADEYRRLGVPVVMGGMHATLAPDEVQEHADSVFVGDAEGLWPQVVEDARTGCLRRRYTGGWGTPQRGSLPDRTVFRDKRYLPVKLLQFSRGCPNHCIYCATGAYFHHKHTCRPVDDVLEEIGRDKLLFFVDDNFAADHDRAKELSDALVPRRLSWVGQVSLDVTSDPELMDLMKRSGCLGFVVGFESLDPLNIRWMNKTDTNVLAWDGYRQQIREMQRRGFQIWAAFTLGHDFDTPASIRRTVRFALEHRFTVAAYNILLPYPGTPLYDALAAEGRLLYDGKWWLHPDYRFNRAAFVPRTMSPEELTRLCAWARKHYSSGLSILRRAFHLQTNLRSARRLLLFLRYNWLFKREVGKKEGMILGDPSR